MNPQYVKGRAAEYHIKRVLELVGYVVTRSAASLGVFDPVALGPENVVAIQVKRGKVAVTP